MLFLTKRLGLGLGLILAASALLLATDRSRRSGKSVALVQHASVPVLDEGADGAVDGLAEHGFREGSDFHIDRYNAHGDMSTANDIARRVVNGQYDLVITMSTRSLQAVYNANQETQVPHVFGLVADPFIAGVGIDAQHPDRHPPYLVGEGIFLPVEESFQLARKMNSRLKKVGVVWNPSESNSKAFADRAKEVCGKMGIELVDKPAENTDEVLTATRSLIAANPDALWVGGDVTVTVALDSVLSMAHDAGIPVFTITPGKPDRGTLFDIGVNFYECGKRTGALAAQVLKGEAPADIPIRDVLEKVPKRLVLNRKVLAGLKGSWNFPEEVVKQADIIVDKDGIHKKAGR